MGVFCKIHVEEPPNGEFTPGSVVGAHIKYAIDTDTTVKCVNVSFRGCGELKIEKFEKDNKSSISRNSEEYIHIQNNIVSKSGDEVIPVGEYEAFFKFQLPEDIPPSLKYRRRDIDLEINCNIIYFIQIEFIVPGIFTFNKKFTREVKVVSNIKPKTSMVPGVIYGDSKTLFQPFRATKSVVNLKAYLKNRVLEAGGGVELVYNISNNTNKTIEAIEVSVLEIYRFKKYRTENFLVERSALVTGTGFKTSSIKSGDRVESDSVIVLPAHLHCLDHSKIVSRDYAVHITVHLPAPHINMTLTIPFQVGSTSLPKFVPDSGCSNSETADEPPTYWEAMNESYEKGTNVKKSKS